MSLSPLWFCLFVCCVVVVVCGFCLLCVGFFVVPVGFCFLYFPAS